MRWFFTGELRAGQRSELSRRRREGLLLDRAWAVTLWPLNGEGTGALAAFCDNDKRLTVRRLLGWALKLKLCRKQ
ncbi:hypothetical protein A4R35_19265 [Thermogemmatispora tikiterensis]|uniref:Uncharacterized protein n=1 Tax=Thermogemmatispora tikiterensis TaxID=1825093 RepID=A0A328VJP0_9CHLR|nr:hypothetical protein A4R35_19265 [Thermogemmatispora tikiterensis]